MEAEQRTVTDVDLVEALQSNDTNAVRSLVRPESGLDTDDIRHSFRTLIKDVTYYSKDIEECKLLSDETRKAAISELRGNVTSLMGLVGELVRSNYQSSDFDIFLFGLFVSKKEWLALAAISVSQPCNLIRYESMYTRMSFASAKVESAYYNFKEAVKACQRGSQAYSSPLTTHHSPSTGPFRMGSPNPRSSSAMSPNFLPTSPVPGSQVYYKSGGRN